MRKRGVGTTLMRRAEHAVMLEQASAMQLEVRISNLPAIRFYKKMGYEPVFQVCGYYSDTEDAIVMMKWFRHKNAKALLF
jgi:ribosomal protein S18 acetylase RimI-like enzyme